MPAEHDLDRLLRSMAPVLQPGVFAFVSLPDGVQVDAVDMAASIRRPDGLSVVVERSVAERAGLAPVFVRARCRCHGRAAPAAGQGGGINAISGGAIAKRLQSL